MPDRLCLGVDFGTSHTVALLRDGDTTTPLIFDGTPLLPSAVYAAEDGRFRMGRDALHSARLDPARFEPNPKRRVDDGSILLGDTEFEVVKVFAAVLERVRDECVRVAGRIPPTTFTHPATWGSARRMVLEDAATAAGFHDVRMRAEPVAAAMYFARQTTVDLPVGSAVVVFDFGGGTFDVSVVRRTSGDFEVLSVDGVEDLGGVDIDFRLVEHLGGQFSDVPEWDQLIRPVTPEDRRFHRTFVDDVRSAKEQLSRHTRADLLIPLLNRETHLTREELEQLTGPLLERALRVTTGVIRAARLESEQIAGVFLVGGASRMPLVATLLHRHTGIAPTVIDQPELVVAHGATLELSQPPVPTPPQQRQAPVPAGQPMSGITTMIEEQRAALPYLGHQATSRATPPPYPTPTASTRVPPTTPMPQPWPPAQQPPADRPPWTLRVAQVALWGEVLLVVAGLALTVDPTRFATVLPWFLIMLPLAVGGAVAATVPRRERWQGWVAMGVQYPIVGLSYIAFSGGPEDADPATFLVPFLLLFSVVATTMLHVGASWFARIPAERSVWWLNLTKVLAGAQFGLLACAGLFPAMVVGGHIKWTTDTESTVLTLHVGILAAAAFAHWALTVQPHRAAAWRAALITHCLMVVVTVVGMILLDGDGVAAPMAAIMFLSFAVIPLVVAARRYYPERTALAPR